MDLPLLAPYTPYVLILGGIIATSWLIRKLSKPAPVVGAPVNTAVKIMVLFSFLVGILLLATTAGVWLSQAWDSRYALSFTSHRLGLISETSEGHSLGGFDRIGDRMFVYRFSLHHVSVTCACIIVFPQLCVR